MQDFIIGLVLICIIASPILYFRIGKKKIAYLNLITVSLFLATWGTTLWRGVEFFWNIPTLLWVPSLIVSTILLLVASGITFYKVGPRTNRVLLPFIMLAVLILSFGLNSQNLFYDLSVFLGVLLEYLTPMFLFTTLIIGAFQYDREVGREKRGA
ncbi:hypothetical protein M3936_20330 [Sutcliffiella horikoshii]|uniref:hypothetical protein n=1 Tax=Sutcliffiella horikoshii TaxID=79883 RepID=UPI00203E3955|nr:hypothetical protein [Sutcliffiella horikoshii]MCM3619924.1 hypothetical protein [Sutcliffiella horikoshii]